LDVHGIDVGLGIDGHGFDVQFLAGTDDPDGNFTAIGYENFLKHDVSIKGDGLAADRPGTAPQG